MSQSRAGAPHHHPQTYDIPAPHPWAAVPDLTPVFSRLSHIQASTNTTLSSS